MASAVAELWIARPKVMMNGSTVILCERTLKWAAALRRHLPAAVRLRQTRALAECAAELDAAPTSFVVVELSEAGLPRVLAFLAELARRWPHAAALVVAERPLAEHEWLVREAGAVHFDVSPRAAADWARIAQNHFRRAPQQASPLAALAGQELPWEES